MNALHCHKCHHLTSRCNITCLNFSIVWGKQFTVNWAFIRHSNFDRLKLTGLETKCFPNFRQLMVKISIINFWTAYLPKNVTKQHFAPLAILSLFCFWLNNCLKIMPGHGALYKPYPIGSPQILRLCHSRFHLFITQKRKMTHFSRFYDGQFSTFPISSLNLAPKP